MQHLVHRQRREPAQVHDVHTDVALEQPAGDAERHAQAVRPGDDRQVVAATVRVRRADRHVLRPQGAEPQLVAVLVQIACVVERDRLEEHADAGVDLRRRHAGPEHRGGVLGRAGEAITRPGTSRSTPIPLSLWKWPPKPFW